MNKILTGALLLLFSSSAAAQTPRDSIAFATAQWRTADLGGGAECRYAQIDMFGSRQSISVATYPGRRFTTSIVHLDRRAESTSDLGKAAGAEIAVNGSYFNVKTFEPVTFVLLDRKIVGRTTPEEAFRTNGVIAFKDRKGRRMEIFPVRHDAVCRRGAPLPLGAGRRPGADRRRPRWSNTPPGAVSTRAAIPGR